MKFPFKLLFSFFILASNAQAFQISPEQSKLFQVRLSMPFGDPKSDIEVYLFTEWDSEKTLEIENKIESLANLITKKAKLYFIDVVKTTTSAKTHANLTFLINKDKNIEEYFTFRKDLIQGKTENKLPSLPDDIIQAGLKVNSSTFSNMKITTIPTLLIYNLKTRVSEKFEGVEAILKGDFILKLN